MSERKIKMRIFFLVCTFLLTNASSVHAEELSKASIKELQFNLNQLGYHSGLPDGVPGTKTTTAINQFFNFENQIYDGTLSNNETNIVIDRLDKLEQRRLAAIKILPEPITEKDYPFCTSVELPSHKDIISILNANGNFAEASLSDPLLADLRDMITWHHAAYWANPTKLQGDKFKNLLIEILSSGFVSDLKDKGPGSDDNMALKDSLLAMMYGFGSLAQNSHINESDILFFHREFKKRLITARDNYPERHDMSRCKIGSDIFGCQNHTYQQQHARTIFGYLFDYPEEFKMGEKLYKFAIDDLSEDGALWREASRSRWSWSYYPHALGQLVSIAELHRLSGNPILDYRSKESKYQIHDAVKFLIDSIEQPELMWKYAKSLEGVDHYNNYQDYKSTEYRDLLTGDTEQNGLKNWYYIYRAIAASDENIRRLDQLVPTFKKPLEYSKHLGFLGQCMYDTRRTLTLTWTAEMKDDDYRPNIEAYDKIEFLRNSDDFKIGHLNETLDGVVGRENLTYSFQDDTITIRGRVKMFGNEEIFINISEPISSKRAVMTFGPGDRLIFSW